MLNHGIYNDNIHIRPTAINIVNNNNNNTDLSSKSLNLISVGRLVKLKKFDILINSVYLVKYFYPKIKLKILGSGPERPRLERLIRQRSLEKISIYWVGSQIFLHI